MSLGFKITGGALWGPILGGHASSPQQAETFVREGKRDAVSLAHARPKIGDTEAAESFFRALMETGGKIQTLVLRDQGLGDFAATLLSNWLIQESCGVVRVDLSGNDIGEKGAVALEAALRNNASLQVLDLSRGNKGIKEATRLSIQGLLGKGQARRTANEPKPVFSLNRSEYPTTNSSDDAAPTFGGMFLPLCCSSFFITNLELALDVMRENQVESINLSHIRPRIGGAGAQRVAEVLAVSKSKIRSISFYDQDIGDAGMTALTKMLATNTSLKEMDLTVCNITQTGAAALIDVLGSSNGTLSKIVLEGNGVPASSIDVINHLLRQGPKRCMRLDPSGALVEEAFRPVSTTSEIQIGLIVEKLRAFYFENDKSKMEDCVKIATWAVKEASVDELNKKLVDKYGKGIST